MPPLPPTVLDERMLLARVGGDQALARGLLREFYVSHADIVHRVRAALGAGALGDAFRLLHRTAGTAANLGLNTLATTAATAEDVVRIASQGGGDLDALDLDSIEDCLHEARAAIQRTDAWPTTKPAPPKDGSRADLIARLGEQLRASDLQALDTAADLLPLLGSDGALLSQALARLDFAEAVGILGALTIREGETRCQSSPPPARC